MRLFIEKHKLHPRWMLNVGDRRGKPSLENVVATAVGAGGKAICVLKLSIFAAQSQWSRWGTVPLLETTTSRTVEP